MGQSRLRFGSETLALPCFGCFISDEAGGDGQQTLGNDKCINEACIKFHKIPFNFLHMVSKMLACRCVDRTYRLSSTTCQAEGPWIGVLIC